MSVLNASIMSVVAALIVGGGDYAMAMKKHTGETYSLLDHIEFRIGDVFAGSGVAKALPRAPQGWVVREATPEDSLRIRGRQVTAQNLAAMAKLDAGFAAIPGYQTENRLYQKGAAEVFLSISFVPANMKGAVPVMGLMQVMSMLDASSEDVHSQGEGSITLRKYIGPELGNFTIYSAPLDGQIFISALSTGSEADTVALLEGIDCGALHLLLINDPTIGQDAPVVGGTAPEKAKAFVQMGGGKPCSSDN